MTEELGELSLQVMCSIYNEGGCGSKLASIRNLNHYKHKTGIYEISLTQLLSQAVNRVKRMLQQKRQSVKLKVKFKIAAPTIIFSKSCCF